MFSFIPRNYLKIVCNARHRTAMTRLRLRNNRLHVETGSWSNVNIVPYNERYCKCCQSDCIEDEYHFVLECPCYNDLRRKYISPYYYGRPSMPKFIALMSTENKRVLRKLAIYIFHALNLRNNTDLIEGE